MAIITGSVLDDVLFSPPGSDALSALAGNDIIAISAAANHPVGETIIGLTGFDRIWFVSSGAGETLTLRAGVTQVELVQISDLAGGTGGTLTLHLDASAVTTALTLIGNDGDNTITGTVAGDLIIGNGGLDFITAGAGNDRIVMRVDEVDFDIIDAGLATEGNTLVLAGTAGAAIVIDLSALAGIDQVLTGTGSQSDFSHVDASDLQGAGVEVTLSVTANTVIGSTTDDVFLVGAGANFSATDILIGGLGDDVLRFTSTTNGQTLTLNAKINGIEQVEISDAAGDTSQLFALNLNAAAALKGMTLTGNNGANVITGTKFDDILNGNGGADTLVGGAGNDLFVIDIGSDSIAADKISDASGTKDYIVFTSTTDGDTMTLAGTATGIDGVYLSDIALDTTGTAALVVNATATTTGLKYFGNDGNNTITGGSGADTIAGGGGTDSIAGGAGNDIIVMAIDSPDTIDAGLAAEGNTLRLTGTAAGQVVIDLSVLAGSDQLTSEGLTQSDFTHVDASELAGAGVTITGSAVANKLTGSAQDDVFIIALSTHHSTTEAIAGGDGVDVLRFTSTIKGQTLTLSAGVVGVEEAEIGDAAGSNIDTTALNLSAAAVKDSIMLTGNDGINILTGSAFDDQLNGNAGADNLRGGLGNDTFIVDSAADFITGDIISDTGGEDDRLSFTSTASGDTLVLTTGISGVDLFVLEGTADININGAALKYGATFTGNTGPNTITGTKFNDIIEAGEGADAVFGGAGNDQITMTFDGGALDFIDAGVVTEGNTLILKGTTAGVLFVDLTVAANADQLFGPQTQSDFSHVFASELVGASLVVIGSNKANNIVGTELADTFYPGLGADRVEGGDGADQWVVKTQAEYDGDIYTDSGSTSDDYIIFDGLSGQTLIIRNNVDGVDAAAAGGTTGLENININASAVTHPFGLAGNGGNNVLTGTPFGESFFDFGGADITNGGAGSDDYVIMDAAYWVAGDRITDTSGFDDLYFADSGNGLFVAGTTVTGIERFVVSSANLSLGSSPYVRDNTTTNGAGIDASGVKTAILLAGNDGNNVLIATRFADTILGHGGNDTITAGLGTDTVTMQVETTGLDDINAGLITENNVLILTGKAAGTVEMNLSNAPDQLTAIGGSDDGHVLTGFVHVNASTVEDEGVNIIGTTAVNKLTGSAQDDTLAGGAGADVLIGGGGDDAFVINALTEITGDKISGDAGDDAIWFASTIKGQTLTPSATLVTGVEILMIADKTGSTAGLDEVNISAAGFKTGMQIIGNDGANTLTGTAFADKLTGNGGMDVLKGGAGNDVYLVSDGAHMILGDQITDISGTSDVLRFVSTTANDTLTLTSGISGLEAAEISDDTGDTTGIDALNLDASAATIGLVLRGNDGVNIITGTGKNDTITANDGNDTIMAGAGADVILMAAEATTLDDVNAGATAEGNTLILTGIASGPMVWDLSSATDQLVSIGGVDEGRIITGITHINASLLDTSAMGGIGLTITGSAEANILIGTDVDDTFIVKSGADVGAGERITAGDGTDTLRFTSTAPGETLTLNANVTGIESALISNAAGATTGTTALNLSAVAVGNAMVLTGNDGGNTITGTAFDDIITGNGGQDTIVAGAGADTVTVQVSAGNLDAANAGALAEGNTLVLQGTAAGVLVVNLTAADQLVSVNGLAEALVQSGFLHLEASAVTNNMTVTGTADANRITTGTGADTINAGAGADIITMNIGGGDDTVNAGAESEGNILLLLGAAAATVTVNLSIVAGDQVNAGEAAVQSGFTHLDASAMTGFGVDVTGSGAANTVTGTALADTIVTGGGADTVMMDVATFDTLDAGGGAEGDTLVLNGDAGDRLFIDYSVVPGMDQIIDVGGVMENAVQSDFQHLDLSALENFGADVRGNGLNNVFTGSAFEDSFTGLGGSDTIDLGTLNDPAIIGDGVTDVVYYESTADGMNSTAAVFSHDQINNFEGGGDKVRFTGEFNGGAQNLDDISDDDSFAFAVNERADFTNDDEALLLTDIFTKLKLESVLYQSGFTSVLGVINRAGVTAALGDDGLIVVETTTSTGFYYFEETNGTAGVQAAELTLLGVLDYFQAGNVPFEFG